MNDVLLKMEEIEDSYPLSPIQEGMLFHTLYAPQTGVDIEQMVWELHEALDRAAFRQAWHQLIERHAILRTAFQWKDRAKPTQIVHRNVTVSLEEFDWRCLAADKREDDFER